MNAYERYRSRLRGERVDRPPNFDIMMQRAAHHIGESLSHYYLDYRVLVAANLAVAEDFGVDILQAISDPYREAADHGLAVEFPDDGLPLSKTPLLAEPEDLGKLRPVAPEAGRRMSDRKGDHMSDPFAIVHPIRPAYQWLRFGEIKPQGWLRQQMQRDLETGFLGRLDELVPDLISDDDIYGRDRLTALSRHKDLGTVATDAAVQVQYMWWNSETQSNWRDGLVRTALLLDHAATLPEACACINHILETQDADGYLGIYAPDVRFNFSGENGELWAQATLFRVLLGYYEATGEARVLRAVERAAQATMAAYPPGRSQPFPGGDVVCGDSHGLAITDALERLSQLTGDATYAQYATWLYAAFSQSQVSQADVQYGHLVDPAYRFREHAAHTYEHLRSLLVARYTTGNPALEVALAGYLAKLGRCLAPSGGPIGDESIDGRDADATETGYEYCSIHELLDSYTHLLQKRGAAEWGDRAEWLLFNAGQGARHPHASAITYLRTDNSTTLDGPLHPGDAPTHQGPQTRYKYSPVHQDVAVCCAPNAGRIYPYFVKAMWLRSDAGLVAALYGPCEVRTEVTGVPVRIVEETNYPFELTVTLTIEVAEPVEFELAFRVPSWSDGVVCLSSDGNDVRIPAAAGYGRLRRAWHSGDRVTLAFPAEVTVHEFRPGERYFSRGPLVFARPIAERAAAGRAYPVDGFCDLHCTPQDAAEAQPYRLPQGAVFAVEHSPFDAERAWQSGPTLVGEMLQGASGQAVATRLVPLGGTVLRQVTFLDS